MPNPRGSSPLALPPNFSSPPHFSSLHHATGDFHLFRAQAAQQKAAADARRDALREQEERQAEDEGSMPESRGKKFSELEAGKWLTQTLLFLRGHTKRVSETTSAFLDRVTADWLAASDLSTATRRVGRIWDRGKDPTRDAPFAESRHRKLRLGGG